MKFEKPRGYGKDLFPAVAFCVTGTFGKKFENILKHLHFFSSCILQKIQKRVKL